MSSSTRDDDERPIPLRVANQKAYVWDVEDVARIRSKYRLCGILAGTLPHLSQQNVFLGIPLVLLPEEVVLLVEQGAAILIDDPAAHKPPSPAQIAQWHAEQTESMKTQLAGIESKNAKESQGGGRALSEEAQRKRKEREERKRAAKAAKALAEGEEASVFTPASEAAPAPVASPSKTEERESSAATPSNTKESSSFFPFQQTSSSATPHTIVVPAPSSSLPWYDPSSCSYSTIDAARAAGVWSYPATLEERARCGVFKSLWEQGYFMGIGIKFGGEYLVYPGDPLRYHSHFTATVLEAPTTTLRPMEIVAHGRLGTATKKAHLLCGWDDDKKEVSYLSIEWAGFG
ncbi:hypothetical protein DFP72DRAFT_322362 [Ephemerocybe angulata]|uniref:tRNA-splicing endonuclease subunit Sen34 n=1 Tax=Ephemerocybe angulata TaxID=980116 RepID=A0A8H6IFP5_9AGAR|nr:hypothetical protein DFP72DRAFT_322362 [Tulosesus angulatus]